MPFNYPRARRDESIVEDHFGHKVSDPYRWLENPDSEETKQFVKDQNDVTMPYIESYELRSQVRDRLTQLYNFKKFTCPDRQGIHPELLGQESYRTENQNALSRSLSLSLLGDRYYF